MQRYRSEASADDTGPYFAELSQALMSDQDVQRTLDRICARALEVVPAVDFAGITVRRRRGRMETLAHTDDVALKCDHLQYELGEGPCVSSALHDEPYLVRSTGHDARWPTWGPAVAALGVHSIISIQLSASMLDADRGPLGAINLYSWSMDGFADTDLQRALVYAVHASHALATAHLVTNLGEAIESRHEIGVAQGVLMQRYGLTADQAFESLQRYSSHSNVKLRDVASLVTEQGGLPSTYDEIAPVGT